MRWLPSGSIPWLLLHELRLTWRGFGGRKGAARWLAPVLAVVVLSGMTMGGFGLSFLLREVPVQATPWVAVIVDGILLLLFSFMLSQTLSLSATAFYERGDLDLLLSSPIPARRVLAVRCLGLATTASYGYVILISPLVLPAIFMGQLRWLGVYPLLIALTLFATACGLMLALGMFALLGPRRTRTVAQVMAAVIGAAFYLTTQLGQYAGRSRQQVMLDQADHLAKGGGFDPGRPLTWPAQALLGDPVALVLLFAGALAVFALVVTLFGARFARNAAAAAGAGALGTGRAARKVRGYTGGPFAAMLRKELRLLGRDIALLSQVLLRVLYLIPVLFLLLRNSQDGSLMIPFIAAAVVYLTGQVAGSLAWITVSGEEGLELLACAPARAGELRRAKLVASLIPVGWLMVPPLVGLAVFSPLAALATGVCGLGAAVCSGLIAIWYERPGQRKDFVRRRRSGSILVGFVGLLIDACWSLAAAVSLGPAWVAWSAFAPIVIAVFAVLALKKPERSYAEVLQTL
jgi:ABC-2 type transport system permease protein